MSRFALEFGQCYTWESPDGTTITWSITEALRIIGDRAPIPRLAMPPDIQRQALERNSLSNELDLAYAMTTDLTKPLIATVSPIEHVPGQLVLIIIDGWHRIKHSVEINNPNPLPVHLLFPDEEKACRIVKITS